MSKENRVSFRVEPVKWTFIYLFLCFFYSVGGLFYHWLFRFTTTTSIEYFIIFLAFLSLFWNSFSNVYIWKNQIEHQLISEQSRFPFSKKVVRQPLETIKEIQVDEKRRKDSIEFSVVALLQSGEKVFLSPYSSHPKEFYENIVQQIKGIIKNS